jgi:hypothetical protein
MEIKDSAFLCDCVVWICPICCWMVSSIEIDRLRFDLDCPGCGVVPISKFEPIPSPFRKPPS